jgi:hypothetical protein
MRRLDEMPLAIWRQILKSYDAFATTPNCFSILILTILYNAVSSQIGLDVRYLIPPALLIVLYVSFLFGYGLLEVLDLRRIQYCKRGSTDMCFVRVYGHVLR